ncbi:MAG: hypothetical protein BWY74_02059 [Firmicutes bacterium ADurb.Bin419]|nr:MAG: hypothetical protein BWY74_02059 [Firmicutes bacterium ADurb.Bin419]
MGNVEKKLSDYIDNLNAEKRPAEPKKPVDSNELEELMDTVKMVRSLKEPALPGADYPHRLARSVYERFSQKASRRKIKLAWYGGIAAIAAVVAIVISLNSILPIGRNNIVYAMEQAFEEVKAYHGIIEVIETNAYGEGFLQAKREVWTDKEGNYYVKELEGFQKGVITVNNGQEKWQIRPDEKKVYIFGAFPDPYRFTFELGNEIERVMNAMEVKVVGEEMVSGRSANIIEVKPDGGEPYRIWVDKENRLPLKRQSNMHNSIQYTVTYSEIEFASGIPPKYTAYNLPDGFEQINTNPEQLVGNIEEAGSFSGFVPRLCNSIPKGYDLDSIAVSNDSKAVKFYYTYQDRESRIIILQGKSADEFKPVATSVLGKVGGNTAEIQSPVEGSSGILSGGGLYAGVTNINSIRWQESGFEYAVIGNVPLKELALFVESLSGGVFESPAAGEDTSNKPQIEVPVDLEAEKNEQISVDAGKSPWRLDPAYVAQVFVSLKIYPEGIQGEYPVLYEEMKILQNDGKTAIVEVSGDKTTISKVYLNRLIRQDNTGIWTVVGYDEG